MFVSTWIIVIFLLFTELGQALIGLTITLAVLGAMLFACLVVVGGVLALLVH